MTGRYILNDDSNFINILKYINDNNNDNPYCIIKYGSFYKPSMYQCEDCITGLIGLLCKYIKNIKIDIGDEPIEWHWAKATYTVPKNLICKVKNLGINICPGSHNYFLV